ncbi:hypothetical protein BC937DRAFT_93326 [Endogone sp. FLAS-F59071]|nr:hypothetical protein BC937DRAFT_93326 [Endogone sp. FLAS-F59071]|eukprot:RUS23382.1 hypothetical protein BC937DRAFT_93326 [Endogone sp. FLAS-F59071]
MPDHSLLQRRYILGIIGLLSVVLIWVSSSFLMNNIFSSQNFNKPFLITYINTASFSLYLVPFLLFRGNNPDRRRVPDQEYARLTTLHNVSEADELIDQRRVTSARPVGQSAEIDESAAFLADKPTEVIEEERLSTREIAKLSITFCILWFLANWSTNASLAYTTVASSTILASMSGKDKIGVGKLKLGILKFFFPHGILGFFTLAIGAIVGIERFNWIKFGTVCISVVGVILVSTSDSQTSSPSSLHPNPTASLLNLDTATTFPSSKLFGDFLALIGALFYGCYTVLLKLRIQNEERVSMPLFFGFVGAFNVCLLWPAFFLLHFTGIERFELPSTGVVWAMVLVNALVGTFLSDYLWLLAMLMTSPLVVTLGLSLTIPLALGGDIIFKHLFLGPQYWCGAILVVAGFVGINSAAWGEVKQEEEEKQLEEQHYHGLVTSLEVPKHGDQATTDSESARSSASYGSMDDTPREPR